MKCVVLECPKSYAGDQELAIAYARACIRDARSRDELPLVAQDLVAASEELRLAVEDIRRTARAAEVRYGEFNDAVIVYTDFGVTEDMLCRIAVGQEFGFDVEYRELPPDLLQWTWACRNGAGRLPN